MATFRPPSRTKNRWKRQRCPKTKSRLSRLSQARTSPTTSSIEKKLQKFKAKLPVQEAQEDRDQSAMYSTLAEHEDKYQKEKLSLETKIQKSIKQREEAVSNGVKEKRPSTT